MSTGMFGGRHILCLGISIALIVVLSVFSKKLTMKQVLKIALICGIISEVIKVFYFISTNEAGKLGYLPKTDLPFHLCSIQIIFFFILNLTNNEKVKRVLYSFMLPTCLIGGIAAILLPTSSARTEWIITAQYFLYHVMITVFGIYLYINKEVKFDVHDYFTCLKFLAIMGFGAIYLNGMITPNYDSVTVNFMYVVAAPQSGLPYLNTNHGWLVYIVHYALLAVFCISCCYCKPIYLALKEKFFKKPAVKPAKAPVKKASAPAEKPQDEAAATKAE